jgi:ABC-type dipeptide/oligopeptide/nickel transport system permease component
MKSINIVKFLAILVFLLILPAFIQDKYSQHILNMIFIYFILAMSVNLVFGYTGVGDLIVDSVINRDYPVLEGAFFYMTLIVILGGLIGDFILLRLDPRLRG